MSSPWIGPKVIIGNTATGEYYFPRPNIEASIWEETRKGNHVLLAAPRRVGKSSVMQAMLQNCPADTKCIFKNIQGIQSEQEFYRQFFELILQCLSQFEKNKSWLKSLFSEITIEEITLQGVKFGEKKPGNYAEEISRILPKIGQHNLKIILFIDELPEVLNNLYKQSKRLEAIGILDRLRQWRQDPAIRYHFSLILAGSVGIHHIVKTIEGRTTDLNDFGIVPFEALNHVEASDYIEWATRGASVQYDEQMRHYLLSKINHFIPYFLNLMLDEIDRLARKRSAPDISVVLIELAFETIVKNSDHFREWKNRLFDYFSAEDADFLHKVLIYIAHCNQIDPRQLFNFALKYQKQNVYMELMRGIEHDGYVVERDGCFLFVSPFLQAFWKRDNPVFDYE